MKIPTLRAVLPAAIFSCLPTLALMPAARAGDVGAPRISPADAALAARLRRLTLDDAIDIALRRNPDILRQLQEIQRTKGLYVEVRARALPQITASATYQQQDEDLLENTARSSAASSGLNVPLLRTVDPVTGVNSGAVDLNPLFNSLLGINTGTGTGSSSGLSSSSFSSPNKNYQITLQVTQAVYDATILPQIRQARFTRDSTYYQLRETVDTVVNGVKTQFYTVLLDRALITIQEESVRLLESQLRDQQNRFAAGTIPRFDVLQAEVAVANQRPQLITARNNLNLAYIALARSLGIVYGAEQQRVAPINVVGNLNYNPQNFSLENSETAAKANRALLKQQRQNILIQVEAVRIAAAGYQPTISASAGVEQRNSRRTDDLDDTVQGWFFGASANWNIFDGLATYGRGKQARAALTAAKITYDDSVRQVVQEVENNYLTLEQSKELIASQTLNVAQAEEAVRLAQARLSAGAGTQLDVLQSQVALTQAQTTELQARYDYAVALANFERVTATNTIYEDTFDDPLTRKERAGQPAVTTGVSGRGGKLPEGKVKTPGVERRGPWREKIDASNPDRPVRPPAPEVRVAKPVAVEKPKQEKRKPSPQAGADE
jgi:outer membrane protein TolC